MSEPRQVSKADVANAYQTAFATPEGQIVLADLMRRFGYTRGSTLHENAHTMAFREGTRYVLVHMGKMMDADPSELAEYEQTELSEG